MDRPPPITPTRQFPRTKLIHTPNRLSATFAPSSQPVGSTQRALQASLTGNVVFNNGAIVNLIFRPEQVDDETVQDIIAEISSDSSLQAHLKKVLSVKVGETKKYQAMVRRYYSILVLPNYITIARSL